MSFILNHGIGGNMFRPFGCPLCLPGRATRINNSLLQSAMAVSLSGVGLVAKVTAPRPAHAVNPRLVGTAKFFCARTLDEQDRAGKSAGRPESKRFVSNV